MKENRGGFRDNYQEQPHGVGICVTVVLPIDTSIQTIARDEWKLTPIWDCDEKHVGWFGESDVFSSSMNWVAFVTGRNLFAAGSLFWLGRLDAGSFQDRKGKAVGWLEGSSPRSGKIPTRPAYPSAPLRPMKPAMRATPQRPLKPMRPIGGWSSLSWHEWLSQKDFPAKFRRPS